MKGHDEFHDKRKQGLLRPTVRLLSSACVDFTTAVSLGYPYGRVIWLRRVHIGGIFGALFISRVPRLNSRTSIWIAQRH